MGGADGDRKRIAAGLGDEFLDLLRTGVALFACFHHDLILDTGEGPELSLYDNALVMGILNNLLGQRDVVLKALGGSIDHDGGEAAVDAVLAQLKGIAVI